ncbi:hypothetical protein ABZW18_29055 [Streptomyces sp. NPDC004647]
MRPSNLLRQLAASAVTALAFTATACDDRGGSAKDSGGDSESSSGY